MNIKDRVYIRDLHFKDHGQDNAHIRYAFRVQAVYAGRARN